MRSGRTFLVPSLVFAEAPRVPDFDPAALRRSLSQTRTVKPSGRVLAVTGTALRLQLPAARVGDLVRIERTGHPLLAEVVGFEPGAVLAFPLGELVGVGPDDPVQALGGRLTVPVGAGLLGRVVDGLGRPLEGGPLQGELSSVEVEASAPPALSRKPVSEVLVTGVRVIDALLTFGAGQRIGLFAGSGVGKSTLLGAITRGTAADVIVVGLVGERGREVGEFLHETLGDALARSVVVVATSDAPAMERLRAAQTATAIAEHFRDQGLRVLLLVDSVTRYARALREVGLAAGEPPTRRGYPPSVFSALPRLLERAGQSDKGSITAVYTVLVEGSDMEEPIADEVRGTVDGHIVLSRELAARGRYPAVDVGASLSRVMNQCVDREHNALALDFRRVLLAYETQRELIQLGAYKRGADPLVDRALTHLSDIEAFLGQRLEERSTLGETLSRLRQVAS